MNGQNYPKILVVDDRQENLLAIRTILKHEEVDVICVDSARKGLEEIFKHDFCLILLDVQMPEMNGYEMADILHDEETTGHIPIIFLTAIDEDDAYEIQAYEAGAVDVIFKPLKSNSILQSKVRVFLRIYHQQQKIQKLKEAAEKASQSKAMFLANMSHEIRTPLNAIIGFIELLHEANLTEQEKGFLHHVDLSSELLFNLINDVLDFSKIEAGTIELEERPINLKHIISDTIETCKFKSREKNLFLKLEYPENTQETFLGDETRIRQILINLINNALKFTEKGGVIVAVNKIELQESHYQINIAVKDTGIGIKEDDIPKIFKSFEQADNTITRKYGGTGLGLNISNSFVNMMQGKFKVRSVWGEGTEMSFDIFLKGAAKVSTDTEQKAEILDLHLKVLVVDDIRANQRLLEVILKKIHFEVHIASTGQEAIDILKKENFDLCFMDLRMPVMGGFEATKIIRDDLKLSLPIIAISADAVQEDISKAYDCGMNDYMTKPFKQAKLKELIFKWAGKSNKGSDNL